MINKEIREKVEFFGNAVRRRLGDNVLRIIIYGSRARGDYWVGSDYDFVVIVRERDKNTRDQVNASGVEFLDRYDELASCLLYDESEWENTRLFPIGINIQREGIAV